MFGGPKGNRHTMQNRSSARAIIEPLEVRTLLSATALFAQTVTKPTPAVTVAASTTVDNFTQITWTTKAPGPIDLAEALKANVNGKLYVFGGFNVSNGPVTRSDVYNPTTDTWAQIASMPERTTHAGVAVYGDDVYFLGGYVGYPNQTGFNQIWGTTHVWIYNTDSNTWRAGPALPAAYAGGGAVFIGSVLHYFGGFALDRSDVNVHYTYDFNNPSAGWVSAPLMLKSVNHMGYANFDGKIYALNGQTGHDDDLVTQNGVQIFDPATNAWTWGASMPAARSHTSSATFIMGDRIIVMGGESGNGVQAAQCYAYTPATNSWVQLTSLPTPRFSGVADVFNGIIYFTGGGNSNVTYQGTPVLSTPNGSVSGTITSGGKGVAGVKVYLDTNNNSKLDTGELSTTTTSTGTYTFSNVPMGSTIVRQTLPSNYIQVSPASNYGNHVTVGTAAVIAQDFTDAPTTSTAIAGAVYVDTNRNGKQDAGEAGLAGVSVYLDLDNSGVYKSADPIVTTDSSGVYEFVGIAPGNVIVRTKQPAGYTQVTPANNFGWHVTVKTGQKFLNNNFGENAIG